MEEAAGLRAEYTSHAEEALVGYLGASNFRRASQLIIEKIAPSVLVGTRICGAHFTNLMAEEALFFELKTHFRGRASKKLLENF